MDRRGLRAHEPVIVGVEDRRPREWSDWSLLAIIEAEEWVLVTNNARVRGRLRKIGNRSRALEKPSYTHNSSNLETLVRISTADLIKNFGAVADVALSEPVRITKHGRDRLVMVSAAEYDRLKRHDRQVFRAEDLPDDILELIAKAEVPAEFAYLDDEVKDWKP